MPTTHSSALEFIPDKPTIPKLWHAAQGCTACDLYQKATQAVLGVGPRTAAAFFIGEQPGDQEDLAGQPFVGPAGQVLNEALAAAGIGREAVYVTNAVKHFKWEPRGKRRIHAKPTVGEVRACRPWLEAELAIVKPRVVVCLGATAAQALMGPAFRITRDKVWVRTSGKPQTRVWIWRAGHGVAAVVETPQIMFEDVAASTIGRGVSTVVECGWCDLAEIVPVPAFCG